MYDGCALAYSGRSSLGSGVSRTPSMPPVLDILWKLNTLVSMGPNYFIFMGNLKIMKRACMFLTLSLYMIMQFLLICMYFSLPSKHVHVCLSVCLCRNIHVPVCVCVRASMCVCMHARTYVLVPCADPLFWPSGLDPLPLTKILDPRMGPPGCPYIYPLKNVKWSIREISMFGRSVNWCTPLIILILLA